MLKVPRQAPVTRGVARLLSCCLAVALAVVVLSAASATAKPGRRAKSGHHVTARQLPAQRHAHLRAARRRRAHARRKLRLRVERRRRKLVVRVARRAVGVPYRWGGGSPRSGFDCSGLTRWVYRHVGVSLPHYSVAQWRYGRRVGRRALAPGDLLFFSGLGHVGIYIGRGALIHAPQAGARVRVERLGGWLSASFDGARRMRIFG